MVTIMPFLRVIRMGIYSTTAARGIWLITRCATLADCRLADSQTCRLADLQTCRLADLQTCRLADLQTCRLADLQTCRVVDLQTCRLADLESQHTSSSYPKSFLKSAQPPLRITCLPECHVSAASKRNGKMELHVSVLHSRVKVLMCGWRCDWFPHFFHFH